MGISDLDAPVQLSPWDYYAEQLMIYILGAGNPNPEHRISSKFYKTKKKIAVSQPSDFINKFKLECVIGKGGFGKVSFIIFLIINNRYGKSNIN